MLKVATVLTVTGMLLLKWFLFAGYLFLLWVAGWAFFTIRRMQREQAIAIDTLNQVAALAGLQRATDKLQNADLKATDRMPNREN